MKKNKSNIKKFIIVYSTINTLFIVLLTIAYLFFMHQYNLTYKNTVLKISKKAIYYKANILSRTLEIKNFDSIKMLTKYIKNFSRKDNNILNITIFSKTEDENYFRVKKIINNNPNFKVKFKKSQEIKNANFLKEAIYKLVIDPNLYSNDILYWFDFYTKILIENKIYIIKFSIKSMHTINMLKTYVSEEKKFRKYFIYISIIFIIISLTISLLYANNHSLLINKLTDSVKKASQGKLDTKINSDNNTDIAELADSFNTLIDDLKAKEKLINKLKNQTDFNKLFKHGVQFIKNGQYDNALLIFKTLTILKPNGYACYFNLGITYAKLKQFDNSVEMFEKALMYNPENIMCKQYYEKAIKMKTLYANQRRENKIKT